MRYGVIRVSPDLPPPNVQRRLIDIAGCDVVIEERLPNAASQRNLFHLLYGLKAGDEVLVHGLGAFETSTGELARLLRHFFEAGVTLRMTGGSRLESLAPEGPIPRALVMLADHETRRPARDTARRRPRSKDTPLTQHQIRFAREMHRRGHSMREIGLLFQLAPNEIAELIRNRPSAPASDADLPA
jgi:DNA invertase Pin-like site-specific DNA recombinase